ncbi:crossover junction endonuclease MUS81-like isoform X2 [Mizuhopecten yessoensis]|uniref:crossover junction endonuclease MUS81-like isoform X2 n=1 Tax=Mizuhopecten yessoensis TaxID=6573 RepID=UPI000B45DE26|nr:crossover junction endonuclease MUS81-like isoform X2 [Mizuhopecten yessoensis]
MELQDHPLYGKRKKRKPVCANPLFLQWLTEWREEAAEKGWKTQYVYGKAIKSLKNYPLPLATGKDCKMLEHFGDKTCKLIDEKLAEHIELHGCVVPPDPVEVPKKAPSKQKKTKQSMSENSTRPVDDVSRPRHGLTVAAAGSVNLTDDDVDLTVTPPPKRHARPRSKSGEQEYVPAYRSGAYGLLLALYRNTQDPGSRGYMSKVELVGKAQPLSDKSFTIPDAGCRYTSWSSMGTLIKKALIIKESNPAKYSITDAGCELAHRLEMAGTDGHVATTGNLTQAGVPTDRLSLDSPRRLTDQHTRHDTGVRSGLEFVYIDEAGGPVQTKDKAQVLIDEDFGIGFLVHCDYHGLLTSGKHYKLDMSRPMGDKVYAHLHDNDAPERAVECAPPPRLPSFNLSDDEDRGNDNCLVSHRLGPQSLPSFDDEPMTRQAVPIVTNGYPSKSSVSTTVTTDSSNRKKVKPKPRSKPNKPLSVKLSAAASQPYLPSLIDKLPTCPPPSSMETLASSQESQESIRSISSMSSAASLPRPDFVLTPGNFDIILCIDNQEFYGSGKNGSKTLLPDLMKNGVNCDLRKLQVGDLLWVAREKTDPVLGGVNQGKGRELVLDYVVERKRMDDLVHSCIDGRLPDQKFRLKHCGINNAIFLIEMYGSMQHFSIAEDRIKQTITNLQIIDGFQIKRTGNTKESVVYLATMTRYIHSYYRNKTLYATSPDDLQGKGHINDAEQRLLTFDQFNQGSVKSKALTVREMFGKQLIQLNGMSAEKAKAVTDKYHTPSLILEAYDNCVSVKDKENLLSNIKSGKAMRNLGQNLSKQIYQLYCTKQALT